MLGVAGAFVVDDVAGTILDGTGFGGAGFVVVVVVVVTINFDVLGETITIFLVEGVVGLRVVVVVDAAVKVFLPGMYTSYSAVMQVNKSCDR